MKKACLSAIRRRALWILGAVFLLSALSVTGHARTFLSDSSSIRCSGGIVSIRDDAYVVQEKCGDPYRTFLKDGDEIWVYNFGQGRSVYYLRFFRDTLRRIQSQRCDIDNRDCVYMGR